MADAFVDTSFVVALINKGDEHHLRALDLASEFERRPLITTDAVLLEIGNALAKSFRAASIQVIDDFLSSSEVQIVHLYPDLFQKAFSLYRMHDVGIFDSLTTDKHFEQAGFRALLRTSSEA